ncbi:hypothetical protein MQC88_12485 [Luteimonas sp. 50]|uniref:Uncharacterized protein n=1 Tax=Cognatiluteimonas sedimenti TaxID=2927791 RepID=A0ABT0A6Y3_9GAMM|nr:hypothetical protein [Lysobacter sedimenti]MCJ0826759.1 hypothetical protein [Lysobacter sedimenti]
MHRTFKALALAAALSTAAGGVAAQDFVFGWNPRTGDVWVDNTLNDINQYGYRYREPFVDEMARYYGAPRDLVTDLLVNQRWAPGDVYYACAIAQVIGQPCRYVADQWQQDHGQGWGVLAQRLGIKPGSPEFHRLKKGFVPTYDRWARPIRIDDSLRIEFPDRGRGPDGIAVFEHPGNGNAGKSGGHGNSGKGNSGKSDRGDSGVRGNSGKGNSGKSDHGNSGKGNSGKSKPGKGNSDKGKGHGKG